MNLHATDDCRAGSTGTMGLDVHLFKVVWDWRMTGMLDFASNYFNGGLAIGFWH
jgi:hypothetical protein